MKSKAKKDALKRMCVIQRQFQDAVIFRVGIKDNGKTVDLISVDNTFMSRSKDKDEQELEVHMPDVPDYIG